MPLTRTCLPPSKGHPQAQGHPSLWGKSTKMHMFQSQPLVQAHLLSPPPAPSVGPRAQPGLSPQEHAGTHCPGAQASGAHQEQPCTGLQRTLALPEGRRGPVQEYPGRWPSAGLAVLEAGLQPQGFQVASLSSEASKAQSDPSWDQKRPMWQAATVLGPSPACEAADPGPPGSRAAKPSGC